MTTKTITIGRGYTANTLTVSEAFEVVDKLLQDEDKELHLKLLESILLFFFDGGEHLEVFKAMHKAEETIVRG
jgi:hypothetical protein